MSRSGDHARGVALLGALVAAAVGGCHSSPSPLGAPLGPGSDIRQQLADEKEVESITADPPCSAGWVEQNIYKMSGWPDNWGSTVAGKVEPTDPLIYSYWSGAEKLDFCQSETIDAFIKAGHQICEALRSARPPHGESLSQDVALAKLTVRLSGLRSLDAQGFPDHAVNAYCPDLATGSR